jgi:hypothetical protein
LEDIKIAPALLVSPVYVPSLFLERSRPLRVGRYVVEQDGSLGGKFNEVVTLYVVRHLGSTHKYVVQFDVITSGVCKQKHPWIALVSTDRLTSGDAGFLPLS